MQYDEHHLRRGVVDAVRKFNLRDVTMVGGSIGGVLALTVASQIPETVSQVVVSNRTVTTPASPTVYGVGAGWPTS